MKTRTREVDFLAELIQHVMCVYVVFFRNLPFELQSRFGDNALKIRSNLSPIVPKTRLQS